MTRTERARAAARALGAGVVCVFMGQLLSFAALAALQASGLRTSGWPARALEAALVTAWSWAALPALTALLARRRRWGDAEVAGTAAVGVCFFLLLRGASGGGVWLELSFIAAGTCMGWRVAKPRKVRAKSHIDPAARGAGEKGAPG